MTSSLTALSPIDGRYHEKTAALAPYLSEFGLIKYRVLVEVRWFQALCDCPDIKELPALSNSEHALLEKIISEFNIEAATQVKTHEQTTNHDVKAVEYYLKDCLQASSLAEHLEFIHFACTSEDINNLAYAKMGMDALQQVMLPKIEQIMTGLKRLVTEGTNVAMLSRTHGQAASPTTIGKEFANYIDRIERQLDILHKPLPGKINGAVGNYNAHQVAYPEINWPAFAEQFVTGLGLSFNAYSTQIEPHDALAEQLNALARLNTILIDFSRDIWGYIALDYLKQQLKSTETGSSTMPHKVNPIDFENAEGNLGLANGLFNHLSSKLPVSRWQRDLSDSTTLRALGEAFGHQLIAFESLIKGLNKISVNHQVIHDDLAERWEILAEPLQTVMRRYGIKNPYEQLKNLTRGKSFSQKDYQDFVESLNLPDTVKSNLSALTPISYIGYAAELAKKKA